MIKIWFKVLNMAKFILKYTLQDYQLHYDNNEHGSSVFIGGVFNR